LLTFIGCLGLIGCTKLDSNDVVKKFEKLLNDNNQYSLTAQMDIVSNEDLYHYDVVVDYMEGDYYKASLINKDNSHEQVIIKNEKGVFVVTPSLNKSFKFQSEWPNNSSQTYILKSLLKDIKNDSNLLLEEIDGGYTLSTVVNYPNNSSLISQKITFNEDIIPTKVEVFNKDGIVNITLKILDIDFDPEFDENHFDVESSVSEDCCEENVSSLDEIIYPMYLPVGTEFKGEETVKTDETERVILTFTGEKSFIMIEEVSKTPSEFEVNNTAGELVFYENILGSITDTSLNWTMNGKDYYIIGENMTNEELLKVAASTSTVSLTK